MGIYFGPGFCPSCPRDFRFYRSRCCIDEGLLVCDRLLGILAICEVYFVGDYLFILFESVSSVTFFARFLTNPMHFRNETEESTEDMSELEKVSYIVRVVLPFLIDILMIFIIIV